MMMYKISISSLIKIKKDRYEKRMMEGFFLDFYIFPFYDILFFKYFYLFAHLCIACAGSSVLCGLFSGCGKQGLPSSSRVLALIVVASLAVAHRLQGTWTPVVAVRRL